MAPRRSEAHLDRFGLVVSACHAANIEQWTRAAPRIVRFIPAAQYLVVTPDDEVDLFKRATPASYAVAPESRYVPGLRQRLAARLDGTPSFNRVGWYLQQFIKIHAVLRAPTATAALIWDADTIPLRRLSFTDAGGRLVFGIGREGPHAPYFDLIDRVLGLRRDQPFSFIAQCLPVWPVWVREMCNEIEARSGKPWDITIIDAIDPAEPASFSEYETLGTFAFSRHPNAVTVGSEPWYRGGGSRYGALSKLSDADLDKIGGRYAYVAFERWDSSPSLKKRLMAKARRALSIW